MSNKHLKLIYQINAINNVLKLISKRILEVNKYKVNNTLVVNVSAGLMNNGSRYAYT